MLSVGGLEFGLPRGIRLDLLQGAALCHALHQRALRHWTCPPLRLLMRGLRGDRRGRNRSAPLSCNCLLYH